VSDFVQLKLVKGTLKLRLKLGTSDVTRTVGDDVDFARQWYRVDIIVGDTTTLTINAVVPLKEELGTRAGLTVKRVVGHPHLKSFASKLFEPLVYTRAAFSVAGGLFSSPLYIGGIPLTLRSELHRVTLPFVAFEPRFLGTVRNLTYSSCDGPSGTGDRHVGVNTSMGQRKSDEDLCAISNPCQNGGECLSTDRTQMCDCAQTNYTGALCSIREYNYTIQFNSIQY